MATKGAGAAGALVDGEKYSFSGSGGSFTGTLHPKFEGSGTDSKGDFRLSHMNSNIMHGGSKLELVGKKTYTSGSKKGKHFKMSGKVDYPATSMSGTWTTENMYTGYSTTESISMTPFYAEPKMSRSRDNKDYLAEAIENSMIFQQSKSEMAKFQR